MRLTILTALMSALALALAGCGSPSADPSPPDGSGPVASGAVRCPGGSRVVHTVLDGSGYVRFADLLVDWVEHRSARVDVGGRTIALLRADGSVSQLAHWSVVTHSHPQGAPIWFVGSVDQCGPDSDAAGRPARSVATPVVTLAIGHCPIEPVTIAGRRWEVAQEDQHGWADRPRKGLTGRGVAWPAGDVMLYRDRGGATLTLVRAGSPWAAKRYLCR